MKKSKLFILPIIASLGVTSCSGIDEEHSIVPMISYESVVNNEGLKCAFEIDGDRLYSMLDNDMSFVLEIYQDNCSLCQTFNPILDEYIVNTHRQFYRLPLNTLSEYNYLNEVLAVDFPNIFANYLGTPSLYFIDKGELTYDVSYKKFSSYTAFSKIADTHFFSSTMHSVYSLEGLEQYLKDYKSTFIYMLDYTSIISSELFQEIHDGLKSSKKPVLIIDANSISAENYIKICDKLDVNITDHFAYYISEGEARKNTNYLNDGGVSLKEWITNYLA